MFTAHRLEAQPTVRGRSSEKAEGPPEVLIEREPLLLTSPEQYRVSLHLEPVKSVALAAPMDGVVNNVLITGGEQAREFAEIVRLESRERQLEFERAKAEFQAAQIEQRSAGQGTEKELAEVRLQIAKYNLELAEHRLDQTVIRAPFDGRVQEVHVVEGQYVRAGEPVARLVDTSQLVVKIPIDRQTSTTGDPISFSVEGQDVSATLTQVLPLTEPFEPLRKLFQSIATGVAVLDNPSGEWHAGQTVYSSLIPRSPVTEVPNSALSNAIAGGRKVQVIRDGFVRDVAVDLLGAVGDERTIVTGAFGSDDELIVRTSQELVDGTRVVARTASSETPAASAPADRSPRRAVSPLAR